MEKRLFTPDTPTDKPEIVIPGEEIKDYAGKISSDVGEEALARGDAFAAEIAARFVADFEKAGDKMVHVSTFIVVDGVIYMTYYANTSDDREAAELQTARIAWRAADGGELHALDVQSVGDDCGGMAVEMVYDTILARADDSTLYILWTAKVGGKYYRLYRPFSVREKKLGPVGVNRLRVGDVTNDFSSTGIVSALAANGLGHKTMYSDIGIMQKFTSRVENGVRYYYTGTYSGDFNAIVKSRDFVTWEYVSQPDFLNLSHWENAAFVRGGKVWYFVRQQDETKYGFLTSFDLDARTWAKPVLIEDCQSRSDFIEYDGALFLVCAPVDREHIGIFRIDEAAPEKSKPVLLADMKGSCFYPFVAPFDDGLAMSYTVSRKHIRLARFDLSKYL